MWDLQLHKKIFHFDPKNEDEEKEKSFGQFDFKPSLNTKGKYLPGIKEF
jgi:hypothetical protein